MNDKELLGFAAKACQWAFEDDDDEGLSLVVWGDDNVPMFQWNPITDDGDALRLAVMLRIPIQHGGPCVSAYAGQSVMAKQFTERHEKDPYAATRRAIVRAAAAIGEAMP